MVSLKKINDQEVISFLRNNIITSFDVPTSLVFYNAMYFSLLKIYGFVLENGIVLKNSTKYYPWGKDLTKSTNKNIIHML